MNSPLVLGVPAAGREPEPRRPTDWKTAAVQRRTRRRYAAERRFRLMGLAAVCVSAGFLAFLLLSMLAGDIFGTTPIWASLFVLKGIYYAECMLHPRRSWQALRQRRANLRAPQAVEAVARPGTR